MYEVFFAPGPAKFYSNAENSLRNRIDRCVREIRRDPYRHNNIKRLSGQFAGLLRFRIGDWRVVYRVNDSDRRVVVVDIGHRRDIYE